MKTKEEVLTDHLRKYIKTVHATEIVQEVGLSNLINAPYMKLVLQAMEEYHSQFSEAVSDEEKQIVTDLADWSRKYPRGRIYPMSKIDMDDELIKIEERAKAMRDGKITTKK